MENREREESERSKIKTLTYNKVITKQLAEREKERKEKFVNDLLKEKMMLPKDKKVVNVWPPINEDTREEAREKEKMVQAYNKHALT